MSHDREFLNQVVTSTLVLEGAGEVHEYAGGYDDWLLQRRPPQAAGPSDASAGKRETEASRSDKNTTAQRRLKYAERLELDALPAKIEALEKDLNSLHQTMADPAFYQQDRLRIVEAKARLEALEQQLREAYTRWEHLESLAEG